MEPFPDVAGELLAACQGFAVTCSDGGLGHVQTPLFAGASLTPDYLIVRSDGQRRFVPVGVLVGVDLQARRVVLGITRREFEQLPSDLPLGRAFSSRDGDLA